MAKIPMPQTKQRGPSAIRPMDVRTSKLFLTLNFVLRILALVILPSSFAAADEGTDFFEAKIRPVLVEHCYACHSADAARAKKLKGDLLLDTRDGIRKGGESGPAVVPGKVKESVLISAIRHESFEMPPKGKLPEAVIADFVKWIEMGAADPRDGTSVVKKYEIDIEAGRKFWSFRPLAEVAVPQVRDAKWPRGEIDRFVLSKLEENSLAPLAVAEPRDLVRRLYFDLLGLPPTLEEIDRFLAAAQRDREGAVAALVDELLKSPHFGERWGRHWLDVARYGESNGAPKNNNQWFAAWRYRDYVIASFNADKPYDQFLREQIAGDLLPYDNDAQRDEQLMATAFLALGSKPDGNVRMDVLAEQLDTVGRSLLGIAIGCARCHDHKFDPVTTHDFYAMAGIFNNTGVNDDAPIVPATRGRSPEGKKRLAIEGAAFATMHSVTTKLEDALAEAGLMKLPDESWQDSLQRYPNAGQRAKLEPLLADLAKAEAELEKLLASPPAEIVDTMSATDRLAPGNKQDLQVRIRGNEDNLGDVVPRGIMQVLYTGDSPEIPAKSSGRLQLAEVLEHHPLAARVMVNRVWHHLFGRGLVRTVDDFGTMGERPTHPELLEWLAGRFVADGYSLKQTVRRIVLSRAYQLTAADPPSDRYRQVDSDNALLWRHSPRRLDGEALRDSILCVSGSLIRRPPTRFENDLHAFRMTDARTLDRLDFRTVFLPVHRGARIDLLAAFNFPPSDLVIGRRETPSVPTQSLFLMNSPLVLEHANRAALRLLNSAATDEERVQLAYSLFFGRSATADEQQEGLVFLGQTSAAGDGRLAQRQVWAEFCQALFCSAEFRFLR
ncbi:Planctomycete cytochrome C [Anatilimnocola aggregata]|uniref:Planctomycete cytochrome C n=1 Tax=Anatilimnocola aggregata TaxID=2528021 RepID=A0A517Y8K9_9BACT|nr:Planctomycete cytochrome C [Anatilimnocola aggregata]